MSYELIGIRPIAEEEKCEFCLSVSVRRWFRILYHVLVQTLVINHFRPAVYYCTSFYSIDEQWFTKVFKYFP